MFSFLTNMVIMYVDIVLLMILLCLIVSACTYYTVRLRRLRARGPVTILLRPTKVLFSHKNEDDGKKELRTVVAYQSPRTGSPCARAPPAPPAPPSPDSGVSDEYEPLRPAPPAAPASPRTPHRGPNSILEYGKLKNKEVYGLNNTWNWNYKEYQI